MSLGGLLEESAETYEVWTKQFGQGRAPGIPKGDAVKGLGLNSVAALVLLGQRQPPSYPERTGGFTKFSPSGLTVRSTPH